MKKGSKLLSCLVSILTALFLLSSAIAVPILWRGFYYGQIGPLNLVEETGFSEETIRDAFDEVMDYLVLDGEFGTGSLRWSEEGMAHFADCRTLFRLDFILLTVTGTAFLLFLLALLIFPDFKTKFAFPPVKGALIFLAVVLLALGVWAFVDFESLFVMFHKLFFPGKENWIFDYRTDQIILILSEAFWLRAAALVAAVTVVLGALLRLLESLLFKKKYRTVYDELRSQSR